jgi:hypothetical protein
VEHVRGKKFAIRSFVTQLVLDVSELCWGILKEGNLAAHRPYELIIILNLNEYYYSDIMNIGLLIDCGKYLVVYRYLIAFYTQLFILDAMDWLLLFSLLRYFYY